MTDALSPTPSAPDTLERRRYGILGIIVAIAFGLFYAYDLWEAVSNLIELPPVYELYGLDASFVPWWLLWISVLIPVVAFAIALVLGRKRNVFGKALIFLVGLTVVAGLSLSAIALEQVLRPELLAVIN